MFLADFLRDDQDNDLSKDLKRLYKLVSYYRRVLKAFNCAQLVREFQQVRQSRVFQYRKGLIVFSKFSYLCYSLADAVTLFGRSQFGALRAPDERLSGLRKPRGVYLLRLAAIASATVFYLAQLKASYQREFGLREELSDQFGPQEVLEILHDLARERRVIFIKLVKAVAECFMMLHFTRASERLFHLKIDSSVVAVVGLLAAILELALEQPLLKKAFANNPILVC